MPVQGCTLPLPLPLPGYTNVVKSKTGLKIKRVEYPFVRPAVCPNSPGQMKQLPEQLLVSCTLSSHASVTWCPSMYLFNTCPYLWRVSEKQDFRRLQEHLKPMKTQFVLEEVECAVYGPG